MAALKVAMMAAEFARMLSQTNMFQHSKLRHNPLQAFDT